MFETTILMCFLVEFCNNVSYFPSGFLYHRFFEGSVVFFDLD